VHFYAYMPVLLCDCQSFIKESYLLTYLLISHDALSLSVLAVDGFHGNSTY